MKHKASPRFWERFRELPPDTQSEARDAFALLKENPRHPSLHFKKIGRFWTVRVGIDYCAVGIEDNGCIAWFWIGPHKEYDLLLKQG